jgi:hypothetical protein
MKTMRNLFFSIPFVILSVLAPITANTLAASTPAPVASSSTTPQAPPNVLLKFTITRNEQTVTHSQVQVGLNHKATLIQQEAKNPYRYKIEVTPSLDPSSAIHLEFRISEISDEETTLLSTPSVIVFNGDSAEVSQKKAHSDELKISVTPTLN